MTTAQPRYATDLRVDIDPDAFSCPETRLAAAVLALAKHDYCTEGHEEERADAERFLFGKDSDFEWWCMVVGWEPSWFRRKTLEQCGVPPPPPRNRGMSKIREAREALGLTQRELADLAGVARGTVMRYELGQRSPKKSERDRLYKVLGLAGRGRRAGGDT